jgi:hypothetical protein
MLQQGQLQKDLIEELGLTDFSQDKQEQLLIKVTESVLKRIFLETMYRLSEAEQASYDKMIDGNASPEEVEKFLREKIADYDNIIKKTIRDFKQEMKDLE